MKSAYRAIGASISIFLGAGVVSPSIAQTVFTWTGLGANNIMSNVNNWAGNVNGTGFGIQTFTGSTRLNPVVDAQFNTHRFIFTNAESFVISGSRITFFDNGGTDPLIRNNSTNVQTIMNDFRGDDTVDSDPLRLDANLGDLVFTGAISNRGSALLIVGGSDSRYVAFGGTIQGSPAVNVESGQMRLLEGGNIDGLNGNMGVGSGGTTNTAAAFYIADMNGGTIVNKQINVNAGNGTSGNRIVGGLNTSGTNTFAGAIVRSASAGNKVATLTAAAGGTVDFDGVISGDHGIIVRGPGTVRFGNANTYAAFTSIESGELHVKEGGTIAVAGQTVFLGHGGTPTVAAGLMIADADGGTAMNRNISVNQGQNANRRIGGLNTSGVNTFGGAISMNSADSSVTLHSETGGTVAMNGIISGLGGINKLGGGTVEFNAANTYAGNTVVGTGTLKLGAGGSVSNTPVIDVKSGATLDVTDAAGFGVQSGQTIKGDGTVNGSMTFKSGSTLAPGNSPGQIIFSDYVLLDAGSTFAVELGGYNVGTEYDQVLMINNAIFDVNNAVLSAAFINSFENSVLNGSVFTVVSGQNSGAFAGLADGDVFTQDGVDLRINYNGGNDITLTVVPEPASFALLGIGIVMALRRRLMA